MEQFPNNEAQAPIITYDQSDYFGDKSTQGTSNYVASQNAQIAYSDWVTLATSPFLPFSFSESQSDGGDITPSGSGSDIDGAPRWH